MNIDDHSHNFVVALSGVVGPGGELEDALFEVGCDDATVAFRKGVAYLEFDRRAPSRDAAIRSALRDVKRADPRLTIVAIETDDRCDFRSTCARLSSLYRGFNARKLPRW